MVGTVIVTGYVFVVVSTDLVVGSTSLAVEVSMNTAPVFSMEGPGSALSLVNRTRLRCNVGEDV